MQKKTKALSEAALITTIISIVGLSAMFIPVVSLVVFLTFVPLIVLGKKHGIKYASLSLVASSIIIGMFAGPVYAVSLILLLGSPSLVMGWLLNKEKSAATIIGVGVVSALVSMVMLIGFSQIVTGVPLFDTMKTIFDESTKMQQGIFASMGTDPAKIADMMKKLAETKDQIMLIIPGALVAWAVAMTLFNYIVAVKILKRSGQKVPEMPLFRDFVLPKNVLIGTIVVYLMSVLATKLNIVDPKVLMANVQILIIYTYGVQGIAVAAWYMHRRKMKMVFQVIIIAAILLSSIGTIMFFMLGVAETGLSIRKRINFKDDERQKKIQ
ncbi:MAG: YybS family protein [Eubacteriales bacterium]